MSDEWICKTCSRVLRSQRGLSKHKGVCNPESYFQCSFCNSNFSSKRCLNAHLKKCQENPKAVLNELKKTMTLLQTNSINNQAKIDVNNGNVTQNTNNTTINITFDKEALGAMCVKNFYDERSLVHFCLQKLIKGDIIKSDAARGVLKYSVNDEIVRDAQGVGLATQLCDVTQLKAQEIGEEAKFLHHESLTCPIMDPVYTETRQLCHGVVYKTPSTVQAIGAEIVKQVPIKNAAEVCAIQRFKIYMQDFMRNSWRNLLQQKWIENQNGRIFIKCDDGTQINNKDLFLEVARAAFEEAIAFHE
jgi:hypothetical protein